MADFGRSDSVHGQSSGSVISQVVTAVKKLIAVRGDVEQAVGMIAELDGISIELATARLAENARRRGISAGAYSSLVLANPDAR